MRFILLFFLFLTAFACDQKQKKGGSFTRAFYYWQTDLSGFNFQDSAYRAMNIQKLYLRFFDVDWDEESKKAVPVAPINEEYFDFDDHTLLVPVIFITNETFKNVSIQDCASLAGKVHKKVNLKLNQIIFSNWYSNRPYSYYEKNPYQSLSNSFNEIEKKDSVYDSRSRLFKEIQFDCDWTASTREKYFAFLKEFKNIEKERLISSTIRLYQYKYPRKAGVPPVDRGILMCYNAGTISDIKTNNSLFDAKEVMSYIQDVDNYALPLDYALPIFNWAVYFRDGKFQNILSLKELNKYSGNMHKQDSLAFANPTSSKTITIRKDFTYGNTYNSIYIRRGDKIRIEVSDFDEVKKVAEILSERKTKNTTLSLFHLNSYDFEEHQEEIKMVFDSF